MYMSKTAEGAGGRERQKERERAEEEKVGKIVRNVPREMCRRNEATSDVTRR